MLLEIILNIISNYFTLSTNETLTDTTSDQIFKNFLPPQPYSSILVSTVFI